MRNNNTTAVSKAQKPILDNINDTESNETEQDESYRCISVSESKKEEKENAVLINMHAKSDTFSMPVIENEKEDSAIEMTASTRSLDSRDDLNDEEVRDSDVSLSQTTVSESKNDDESKGRETNAEEVNLEIESDTVKGGNIKFDTIDDVQEEEASLDNCVEQQNQINLQETGVSNKGPISLGVLEDSNVQIEQRDVPDANLMENECKDFVSTTESENQSTTSEASGQKDNAIDEDRFLYRLLRPGECYNKGIEPKNVYSNTSINYHVAKGSSDGVKSRYISCSKTRDAINRFASYIKQPLRFQLRHIVRIDKTKLDDDCEIYDLTEDSVSTRYLRYESARRHARDYAEVLLAPSREIPVWCFELAGSVQDGKVNWIGGVL